MSNKKNLPTPNAGGSYVRDAKSGGLTRKVTPKPAKKTRMKPPAKPPNVPSEETKP